MRKKQPGSRITDAPLRFASRCTASGIQRCDRCDRTRQRRRAVRPSARAELSLRHRDVGALLVLRHEGAARAIHGEVSAAARARADRYRLRGAEKRTGVPVRAARHPAAVVAYLRPLHRPRLSDSGARRLSRRPRTRPASHRRDRRCADGAGPFHDGVRAAVSIGAVRAHLGNGAFKPKHLDPGRHALCAGRSAPRPRLLDLLCRHQSRRVPGALDLRHARRGARLALRLRRRRRRHDARAGDLSLRLAHPAARRAQPRAGARQGAAVRPRRMARHGRAHVARAAGDVLLGTYEQQGNTIALWADDHTDRTINLLFWAGKFPSPGSRPSTRS